VRFLSTQQHKKDKDKEKKEKKKKNITRAELERHQTKQRHEGLPEEESPNEEDDEEDNDEDVEGMVTCLEPLLTNPPRTDMSVGYFKRKKKIRKRTDTDVAFTREYS